ncbi:MAG: hypothetical protein ChlgKO_03280 [Chlamydiales bacterium]
MTYVIVTHEVLLFFHYKESILDMKKKFSHFFPQCYLSFNEGFMGVMCTLVDNLVGISFAILGFHRYYVELSGNYG